MNAFESKFIELKRRGEGALIAYVCGGDPEPNYTPDIVDSLIRGGADVIELGIPFSDPIADGPTIQAASVRALNANTTPIKVLEIADRIKDKYSSVPLAVLTYYNSIFRIGLEKFLTKANDCGVDGIIVPDLPVEEAEEYKRLAMKHGVETIFLATPNTSTERLERIIDYSSGFLYLVSVFGVTGTRDRIYSLTLQTIKSLLPRIKGRIPLAVGFGISEPEHVRTIIRTGADGVIVGSAFVKIIEKYRDRFKEMFQMLEKKASTLKAETL